MQRAAASVYRIPAAHIRARAALTNTAPTNPYRSAGRPEAIFVIERMIDIAARQFGYDRIDLRRRNLIPPSGAALRQSARHDLRFGRLRQDHGPRAGAVPTGRASTSASARSRRNGKLRGIGLANYLEITSGAPREYAKVDVQPEGRVDVTVGTLSSGQGHETSFAQCVAEWLGVPMSTASG